jgi:hypothetical protein
VATPWSSAQETFRTLAEAREAKGNRDTGDRRPAVRVGFEDYFDQWIDCYATVRHYEAVRDSGEVAKRVREGLSR